jgi:lipid-binding SYLF domain-containing protein
LLIAIVSLCAGWWSKAYADTSVKEAEATIATFKRTDPGIAKFFEQSDGYVVFPTVGKGGLGVGGAHGSGIVFKHGQAIGTAKLTQVTFGAQVGGQSYSQIVFLETPSVLAAFEAGHFALAAQVSAVALAAGASANAKFEHGVAVFTATKGGLMYEASVGGQKFSFEPFASNR